VAGLVGPVRFDCIDWINCIDWTDVFDWFD
jgi:hypothetical protein